MVLVLGPIPTARPSWVVRRGQPPRVTSAPHQPQSNVDGQHCRLYAPRFDLDCDWDLGLLLAVGFGRHRPKSAFWMAAAGCSRKMNETNATAKDQQVPLAARQRSSVRDLPLGP